MTIRVIKKVENMFKTSQRPSWYPTFLVECSGCERQFHMIKYDIWKTKLCRFCANKKKKCETAWCEIHYKKRPKKSSFYKKRQTMNARCTYPCVNWFKNYWGRWIKCEWRSFAEFKNDMYESYMEHVAIYWEKDTTIDRVDVNWNYCKENCRWLTMKEQQSWKRNNHRVVYKWKEYPTLKLLCDEAWKNYYTVHRRICKYWWDVEEAIDKPIYHKGSAL